MDPPQASSSTATTGSSVNLGVRKRVDSDLSQSSHLDEAVSIHKRQRTSLLYDAKHDASFNANPITASPSREAVFRSPSLSFTSGYERTRTTTNIYDDRYTLRPSFAEPFDDQPTPVRSRERSLSVTSMHFGPNSPFTSPRRPLYLHRSASFTGFSRSASPMDPAMLPLPQDDLGRSMAELLVNAYRGPGEVDPFPEASAQKWLKNTRITFDYAPPTTSNTISSRLLSCSGGNMLYFTRGDRVHNKNLSNVATDDVVQLCKLKAGEGHVRALASNFREQRETLAVGTSRGHIQLWDVDTKKMKATWKAVQDISAMVWNGPTLTIGSAKGTIRTYDTRIPANKIKDQSKRFIRHEAQITSLVWSGYGKYLASGDASGTVLCWDNGKHVPMDIGEPIQRRKKMVHAAKISAIAWCPWKSSEMVTGDADGVVRFWDIHQSSTNVMEPGKIETRAAITSMHFCRKAACPELLMTHGAASTSGVRPSSSLSLQTQRERVDNSISVVDYPSFKSRAMFRLDPEKAIGDSVLDAYGTKVIYTTPADGKINIADVWKKREIKELRKQSSLIHIGPGTDSRTLLMQRGM